ncbi:oxidoreductase [Acuticoccus mangrovi]|uniref:FAD-dependent oxidoreductase n=1 Tax=Acuticoccus mangrovi TaxID=2796142 RepID=A0A934INE5_9HYPH|nr:FAD-dependent oxidoreductase [Acuticoccus mangrovi]MBJ3775583.1 FAD-dependent oxidoreductase [Acuticoccus mangrovi]
MAHPGEAHVAGGVRYPSALSPIEVGGHTLRNRIFVPAHTTNFGADNLPSERHVSYHRARAEGGVGLIIFEGIRVHESSLGRAQGVNGYERAAVPAFARVAEAVQGAGAKLFGQIIHLGRHIDGNFTRTPSWSASPTPWTATAPPPHPMTAAEIAEVVEGHRVTALHLLDAGLDGIELQLAHGHLLQQFLSPAVNGRDDDYGGSLENRLRFPLETLFALREAMGEDATLGVRISADELLPGGLTLQDMTRVAVALASAVKLDFINVSHSAYHGSYTISTQMADMNFAGTEFRHLAPAIKQAVGHLPSPPPVLAVCRFRDLADAEPVLAAGEADMVGMARAHIADPAVVTKAAEGREREIRPCVSCNQGCVGFLSLNLAITCLTNPAAGREAIWAPPVAAEKGRRVIVVGGGPGGMEAALTAAQLGHRVSLWEAGDSLGGTLAKVTAMPLRFDFDRFLSYHDAALLDAGVEVRTGTRGSVEALIGEAPEVVILATGAEPKAMALSAGQALTLEAALADPDLGHHVVLQDLLGTWSVVSVAEWLAGKGHKVTLLAPTGTPGWTIPVYSSFAMRHRLKEKGVRIIGLHTVAAFEDGVAHLVDQSTGDAVRLEGVDAVVAPAHGRPRDGLAPTLREAARAAGLPLAVRIVGDAQAPRTALEAIFEGHEAARAL